MDPVNFKLIIISLITLATLVAPTDALICCNTAKDIVIDTNEGKETGVPCMNKGTNCTDVGCSMHQCIDESFEPGKEGRFPENACETNTTCPYGNNALCRIVYWEQNLGDGDEITGISVTTTYHITTECFDNSEGDVRASCSFYRRMFYFKKKRRVTFLRECFCDQDFCNYNLTYACFNTNWNTANVSKPCSSVSIWGGGKMAYVITQVVAVTLVMLTSQRG